MEEGGRAAARFRNVDGLFMVQCLGHGGIEEWVAARVSGQGCQILSSCLYQIKKNLAVSPVKLKNLGTNDLTISIQLKYQPNGRNQLNIIFLVLKRDRTHDLKNSIKKSPKSKNQLCKLFFDNNVKKILFL